MRLSEVSQLRLQLKNQTLNYDELETKHDRVIRQLSQCEVERRTFQNKERKEPPQIVQLSGVVMNSRNGSAALNNTYLSLFGGKPIQASRGRDERIEFKFSFQKAPDCEINGSCEFMVDIANSNITSNQDENKKQMEEVILCDGKIPTNVPSLVVDGNRGLVQQTQDQTTNTMRSIIIPLVLAAAILIPITYVILVVGIPPH